MKSRTLLLLDLVLMCSPVFAATEYLRFEGSIINYYDEYHSGYDASYGFVPNQTIYFDFQIDTNLDAIAHPDSSYQDNFAVTYLNGSMAGPAVTYGTTSSFPEGITSWLFITNSLFVGTSWDWLGNPSDESINTWSVGDNLALMNNAYFSDYIIGDLILTYRGDLAPPAIVPLPAAFWLFGSGLIGLSYLARRSKQCS